MKQPYNNRISFRYRKMKYQKIFPLIGCGIAMICLTLEIERVGTRVPDTQPFKLKLPDSEMEFLETGGLTYAFPPYCPTYKSNQEIP